MLEALCRRFCHQPAHRAAWTTLALIAALTCVQPACGVDDAGSGDGSASGERDRDRGRRTGVDGDDAGAGGEGGGTDAAPGTDAAGTDTGGSGGNDGGTTISDGPVGAATGTVWAPGNAPGMVPAGQEIPIFGALVYVSATRPAGIPDRVYCEACQDPPERSVLSGYDGRFTIENVVPGPYWLVIEKGQFRRELEVAIVAGEVLALSDAQSTLPSVHDPDNGFWIPSVAIAVGEFDQLEDIFGKMGMGEVDGFGEFVPASVPSRVSIWDNGSVQGFQNVVQGTLTELVSDLDRLLDFHILFIPCAGDLNTDALQQENVLNNLRDYVAAGGKLYVTDWSGEWMDNVFPAPIELGDNNDTPAAAYDPDSGTWNSALFGTANGQAYDTHNAQAVDEHLNTWLDGQTGPSPFHAEPIPYDADDFDVQGSWNTILSLTPIRVGTDEEDGSPLMDEPHVYVIGGTDYEPEPLRPLTVTFEPVGCGRVLYSTYHTTDDSHEGLTPQERVLLYLIMEIGICKGGKEYYDQ